MIDIKMYMHEISKFKISDLKAQKNDHFIDCETCISYKETPCTISNCLPAVFQRQKLNIFNLSCGR